MVSYLAGTELLHAD